MPRILSNIIKLVLALIVTMLFFFGFHSSDDSLNMDGMDSSSAFEVSRPFEQQNELLEDIDQSEDIEEEIIEEIEVQMQDITLDVPFESGEVSVETFNFAPEMTAISTPVVRTVSSNAVTKAIKPSGSLSYQLKDVDSRPSVIRTVKPNYPPYALKSKIEGKVYIKLSLDVTGRVKDAKVIKAIPEGVFEKSALAAVRQWQFNPAYKDKKRVNVWGVIVPISFLLER